MRNLARRALRTAVLMIDKNCSWCGGTGVWTDDKGKQWPCIQCNR